jgi:hypothetical protein
MSNSCFFNVSHTGTTSSNLYSIAFMASCNTSLQMAYTAPPTWRNSHINVLKALPLAAPSYPTKNQLTMSVASPPPPFSLPASDVVSSVFSTEIWFWRNSSVVNFPVFRASHRTVYYPLQPRKLLDVPRVRFFCSFRPSIQNFHIAWRSDRASLARACPPI